MSLTGLMTAGFFKAIKNEAAITNSCKGLAANALERAKLSFQRTQASKAKFDAISAQGLYDAANKSPYNARLIEMMLKSRYGEEAVVSHTMPRVNAKNVGLAGTRHPETGIVFNERGMPIFDDVMLLETRITGNLGSMRGEAHKIAATKQLKADIETGKVDRNLFSDAEWTQIEHSKPKIGDYTWHHHQDTGRMQLVPEDLHDATGHIGGNKLWGTGK